MDIIKKIGKAIVIFVAFLILILILAGISATFHSIIDDHSTCIALITIFIFYKIFQE